MRHTHTHKHTHTHTVNAPTTRLTGNESVSFWIESFEAASSIGGGRLLDYKPLLRRKGQRKMSLTPQNPDGRLGVLQKPTHVTVPEYGF